MSRSRSCLFLALLITASFLCSRAGAQTQSTASLIRAWQTEDITQTAKAEASYKDLNDHINAGAYTQRMKELEAYADEHPDTRLKVRITMYRILGQKELFRPVTGEDIEELKHAITLAGLLGDQQLLSELYTLLGETLAGSSALFYDLKAIEIQNRLGAAHFPMLWLRYLTVSECLYNTLEYRQCIEYGKRCLEMMQTPAVEPQDYILQLDNIGDSYRELNMPDSSLICYNMISKILSSFPLDSVYKKIWTGIVAGETGEALFLKKDYAKAIPLLVENIRSSIAYGQLDDAARAQNTLSGIRFTEEKYAEALAGWRQSWRWAVQSNDLKKSIQAVKGITEVYKATGRYDSAYWYSEQLHLYSDSLMEAINNGRLSAVKEQIEYGNLQTSLTDAQELIDRERRTRNAILAGILVAMILSLAGYNRYRLKQKYRRELLERRNKMAEMEIGHAREQITEFTRNISEKNRLIENLQAQFQQEADSETLSHLRSFTILTDEDWLQFKRNFETVYPDFWEKIDKKFPGLTPGEKRFMALSRLGLDNKEIAAALGVSPQTIRVQTHRLRKKLDVPDNADLRTMAESI